MTKQQRVVRGLLLGLAAMVTLTLISQAAMAQGPGKDKGAQALVLLLAPVYMLVGTSLQLAVMAALPRFSRRCAGAVRSLPWQTGLLGIGVLLVAFLATAVLGAANEQAAFLPLSFFTLFAIIGGVGVAAVAGQWGMRRIDAEAQAHPVVEVLLGNCVLGWTMTLIPCLGQMLWLVVLLISLGAVVMVWIRGAKLDEVRRRKVAVAPPVAAQEPVSPAEPEPPTTQPAGPPDDTSSGQVF